MPGRPDSGRAGRSLPQCCPQVLDQGAQDYPLSAISPFATASIRNERIEPYLARPATKLAYTWLIEDLRTLGWAGQACNLPGDSRTPPPSPAAIVRPNRFPRFSRPSDHTAFPARPQASYDEGSAAGASGAQVDVAAPGGAGRGAERLDPDISACVRGVDHHRLAVLDACVDSHVAD